MLLSELTRFLDAQLTLEAFSFDCSNNGLQIEGVPEVSRAVFAVDGVQSVFDYAAEHQAEFVFVHHGLSWGGEPRYWTGIHARRFGTLFRNGISLYAAHLPLDAHPVLGNNARLADRVGLSQRVPFLLEKGVAIGCAGVIDRPRTAEEIAGEFTRALPAAVLLRGDASRICRRAAIVSGSGGTGAVREAVCGGYDLLITGEITHVMHHLILETGLTVLALGHYASETTGPKAVMELVRSRFPVECLWADFPTGL